MNRAIIMCSGSGLRWGSYRGAPKQLVKIGNEILLERTVRQAKRIFDDVIVVARSETFPSFGAELFVPKQNENEEGKILNSFGRWLTDGRTTILYGDVYFTDRSISYIRDSVAPISFLLRSDGSKKTGKTHGEIFSFAFDGDMHEHILAAAEEIKSKREAGNDRKDIKAAGWVLLSRCGKFSSKIECDDFTEDFDSPKDLEMWERGFENAS